MNFRVWGYEELREWCLIYNKSRMRLSDVECMLARKQPLTKVLRRSTSLVICDIRHCSVVDYLRGSGRWFKTKGLLLYWPNRRGMWCDVMCYTSVSTTLWKCFKFGIVFLMVFFSLSRTSNLVFAIFGWTACSVGACYSSIIKNVNYLSSYPSWCFLKIYTKVLT